MSPSPSYDAITIHDQLIHINRLQERIRYLLEAQHHNSDAYDFLRKLCVSALQCELYYNGKVTTNVDYHSTPEQMFLLIDKALKTVPVLTIVSEGKS